MKIYRLPVNPRALIFDMDLTLYSHPEYGRMQIEKLIEIAGKKMGMSPGEAKAGIVETKKAWADAHEGQDMSLSNIILSWGFTMEDNIRWREEAYNPEDFLKADPKLCKTLKCLSQTFTLGIVTNNPVSIARRTLAALDVADCFPILVGLDTCMVPKPHKLPFITAGELLKAPLENCVSIGDRYDIDLALPLELGMGALLVDGVEDVYCLPGILG